MHCMVRAIGCLLRNVHHRVVVTRGRNRSSESVQEASHEAMEWLG